VRHLRSDAYSAKQILLNKPQIYGGAPKLDGYRIYETIIIVSDRRSDCKIEKN